LTGAAALALLYPFAAAAQDHAGHAMAMPEAASAPTPTPAPHPPDQTRNDMPGESASAAERLIPPANPLRPARDHREADHAAMDHAAMDHTRMNDASQATGQGSGTARLPASEGAHHGLHMSFGRNTTLMLHGLLWGVATEQTGPRGGDKVYVQSMAMASVAGTFEGGRYEARTMLSLEPAMRHDGYPNLFATGETAYGEPLVDRQHPHDLVMELAGRVDLDIAPHASVFVYGGPVGEPALGPSAFMHRASARYNPEAPITHHWFDSTHITYGVVTAGVTAPHFQVEASAFRGGEPDERRWNIETPKLDSWSMRASFAPSPRWLLQASYGRLKQPEGAHPRQDERRATASAHYNNGGGFSAMAAFSAKDRVPGKTLTAWLGEANWNLDRHHTLFGRVENVANDELFPDHAHPLHDLTFRITKLQAGYAYRLPLGPVELALGGTVAGFLKPEALDAFYGRSPMGYTAFARLSFGD
jgi:hypothetical protein